MNTHAPNNDNPKTLLLSHQPNAPQEVLNFVDDGLSTMNSIRATISMVLKVSPNAISFFCDTWLNIPLITE